MDGQVTPHYYYYYYERPNIVYTSSCRCLKGRAIWVLFLEASILQLALKRA